ncbi:MAG: BON domain-containing protein [Lysobacter sp.]
MSDKLGDKGLGSDLRAMAQDVVDLGAQYIRIGRHWLDAQRDEVTRGERRDGSADARPPPGWPTHRRSRQGVKVARGQCDAGMETYLDDRLTSGYINPADTQQGYPPPAAAAASDYLPPGHFTRGRISYAGIGPKNYVRSDVRITEDLCERLRQDEFVDPSDIEVNVSEGAVMLGGTVPTRKMKHRIEDLAAECDGVRNVENTIHVRPPTPPPVNAGSVGDG